MKKVLSLSIVAFLLLIFFTDCKNKAKEEKENALKAYGEIITGTEEVYNSILSDEGKSQEEVIMNLKSQMQDVGEKAAKNNGFKDYKELQVALTKLKDDKDLLDLTNKFQTTMQTYSTKMKEKFQKNQAETAKDSEEDDEEEDGKDGKEEKEEKDE